jgi:hypothetical protein
MPRPLQHLSDEEIEQRVHVTYHRAQALARNRWYCRDLERLRDGFTAHGARVRGLHFDERGFLADLPFGPSRTLFDKIRDRTRLALPMLPGALRGLSLDNLRCWPDDEPIFDDLPGRTYEPIDPAQLLRAARLGYTLDLDAFKMIAVPLRRLAQRHRNVEDVYPLFWEVYDRRQAKQTDHEIAQALWPDLLERHPDDARQRVYDYLDGAHRVISAAYSRTAPRKERRRRAEPDTPGPRRQKSGQGSR